MLTIYILLSIKTRIETRTSCFSFPDLWKFISYYPLKQGLKPQIVLAWVTGKRRFISYYPLKQGLKPQITKKRRHGIRKFISYYPLKQGLKPRSVVPTDKTRMLFISYYPLKQGLKLTGTSQDPVIISDLYPTIH